MGFFPFAAEIMKAQLDLDFFSGTLVCKNELCGVSFNEILLEKEVQLRFAQPLQLEEVQLSWGTAVSIDIAVCLLPGFDPSSSCYCSALLTSCTSKPLGLHAKRQQIFEVVHS